MAFIVVPHLDPSHESAFTTILSRSTPMKVVEIENGMRVEADHVYVIPPNCQLTISDHTLLLQHMESSGPLRATIDIFLRSLASDQKNNAIGVVLSGTGSDGTVGLTAIKGEGGITFAQDPESAKYDSMPASAIAAGCVDVVLPPQEIAKELARVRKHPYVARPAADEEHIAIPEDGAENLMAHVFKMLRRATKVDFSEYKPPTIGRRIQRRMVLHKVDKLRDYVMLLQRHPAEVLALYQDLLINVTSFFRNQEAFEALRTVVYPEVLKARGSSSAPLRIWVPGCSTGEEPYSHAISLMEFLAEQQVEVPIQIFGTDLSESAIQRARGGVYKDTIEADVSAMRLRRFFHRVDGGYQISKTIRDVCIFSTQNVFSDPPFSRIDLVSCRNVMIYLGQGLQKRVIPIFHYALNPNGFLMIGSTEGLLGAGSDLFEMADKKQKIYRKKMVATPVTFGFSVTGQHEHIMVSNNEMPMAPSKPTEIGRATMEMQREADRLLLTRYVPPAVVINSQLEILQTRGHTGPYLELPPGKVSLNLLKMARPGLLYELQNAIEEARKKGEETKRDNVPVDSNGKTRTTCIRVIPFKTPVQEQHSFLIVFEPPAIEAERAAALPDAALAQPMSDEERSGKDRQIAQLKQELAATKEYLQSIIETHEATNEELQSANEEIQSSNEELQSTNEELQTSKEELESANEELHTVNEEMQHRNELLAQLNNDLNNLLNSVNLPMVMVGSDLSVRRFNPQAGTMLGLLPSDVGRQIPRLKLKIDSQALENMILEVVQQVQPKHYTTENNEGRQSTLRINPYRTIDNRIEGVVLSIVDSAELGVKKNAKAGGGKKPGTSSAKKKTGKK